MASYTESAIAKRQGRIARHNADAAALERKVSTDHTPSYVESHGAWVNAELVKGAGVVCSGATVRYSRAYASLRAGRATWANVSSKDAHDAPETLRAMPSYGYAYGVFGEPFALTHNGRAIDTMRVDHADGTVTFVSVASMRRIKRDRRAAARKAATAYVAPLITRMAPSARDAAAVADGIA